MEVWKTFRFMATFSLFISFNAQLVTVQTSRGSVTGYHADFGSNMSDLFYGNGDVFLGIPYAQAPIGNLRFQLPQRMAKIPGSSDGDSYNATYFRPACPQLANIPMSEDCLQLNIITPNANSTQKYPVMLWIHGGGNKEGHAQIFAVKGAIRNLVSRGFFTTLTSDFPANLAMYDQVEAIRWVIDEIANFGGDPLSITLFGESAGGASISAHTYSPLSQGLFQQAIMQSGTVLTCFDGALGFSRLSESRALALCNFTDADWQTGDFSRLKACLQDMSYSAFLPLEADNIFGWKMALDNDFMPNTPRVLAEKRRNIPILVGSNKDEWALYDLIFLRTNITQLENYNRGFFQFWFAVLGSFLGPRLVDVRTMMESVYVDPDVKNDDHLQWLQINNAAFTAAGFTGFIARDVDWYLRYGNQQVYLYEFTHQTVVGRIYTINGWLPVPHTGELYFLWMGELTWATAMATGQVTPDDFAVADFFGKTWTDFAKKPSNDDWLPTRQPDLNYYEIRGLPRPQERYRPNDRLMWNKVVPALVGEWPPPLAADVNTTIVPTTTTTVTSTTVTVVTSTMSTPTTTVPITGTPPPTTMATSIAPTTTVTETIAIPMTSPSGDVTGSTSTVQNTGDGILGQSIMTMWKMIIVISILVIR